MRTKIYAVLVLCASVIFIQHSEAQCNRYKDMIFSNVTMSTVVYSTPYTQHMDIYQPTGDTAAQRRVIILAHGGSFVGGARNESTIVTLCTNFAKRGYVTASIDYRLGNAIQMLDSTYAITTVLKAISDGKAAIRFFRQDAYTTNTYKIDTNCIITGGNSAGAVLYIHVIYLDSLSEAPADIQTIVTANGGFEGNSGNPFYSSSTQAVINLAGALNVPEFIGPGSKPSFNAQGTADMTVPYNCGYPNIGVPVNVRLCGLGVLEGFYNQYNVIHQSIIYPGEGHVPWSSNAAELTQIDTNCANFLYSLYALAATSTSTNASCNGGNDGSAALNITGGYPGYTVNWSNGATSASLTGLAAGTYTATVIDVQGCVTTSTVTITEPLALVLTTDSTDATTGQNNGSVNVTPNGGTPPYTITWSNGGGNPNTGLAAGTYTVTVTDANGCSSTKSATVNSVTDITALLKSVTVHLFPNPATDELNFKAGEKISYVTVFDNTGRIVAQKDFETVNGSINTSSFSKGIYQIRIEFTDKNVIPVIRKAIIE